MISSNIDLTMAFVPKILQLPKAQEVLVGRSVVFPVIASGDPILRYQWLRNGSPIRGASTPRLILTETRPSDAGGYSVRISNALGEVTREPALLTVASGQMSVAYRLDGIRIPVVGDPDAGDYVQRSTDLLTWESVATVLNTGVTWEYRDGIELEAGQVSTVGCVGNNETTAVQRPDSGISGRHRFEFGGSSLWPAEPAF